MLAFIEQPVRRHHFASRIAEQWERDPKLAEERVAALGVIDRDRGDARACFSEVVESSRVIRQLAEAERSPMTAIENDDADTARNQIRESALHAGRVGELEIGRCFADCGYLAFVHANTR